MKICLTGPPGVGKSTVSHACSTQFDLDSTDLDDEIEAYAQKSIPEIIGQEGEKAFRNYESKVLKTIPSETNIISLGGGSLTNAQTRNAARKRGLVFGLSAETQTIRKRLNQSDIERPLLRPDENGQDQLEPLLEARKESYAAVDFIFDAEDDTKDIAKRIIEKAEDTWIVHAHVGQKESRVIVGRDLAQAVRGALLNLEPTRTVVVVSDAGVPQKNRDAILEPIRAITEVHEIVGGGGEAVKSWDFLGKALNEAIQAGAGRQSVVIGLGGGATCDLAGLLAALLGRGAGLIMVPSTVVSQVDASVGGKTAVNMAHGRNLVGSFYPASDVIVDIELLESLDEAEYKSGLAEVLKMGIIRDPELFDSVVRDPKLTPKLIAKAIAHKAQIVAEDPFEKGQRKLLNLGHTLAHALESASNFQLRHGDAVAIGTAAIARLCADRNWLEENQKRKIIKGLSCSGLPIYAPQELIQTCAQYVGQDKKSDRKYVDLIIVRKLGETEVMRVELENIVNDLVRFGGIE